ncbi:hypothetical protein SASPL_133023 [Salvia splendens]|uniref:Alcohol dehydrogenase-like C-terminal domain-containing protein n=1 Tax=Salvia splendens TaxID=180675 RepID=A0A8X8ZIQ3_SALSN|nr:hypothetical protein SASPL_133023 [Salvia splendens]
MENVSTAIQARPIYARNSEWTQRKAPWRGTASAGFGQKRGSPSFISSTLPPSVNIQWLIQLCVVKVDREASLKKMCLLSCGVSTAQAIGITDFINPMELDKPTHQRIREMTEGGVDYSFECAGNLDVLREAFLSTHDGWGLTVILGVHPTPRLLPLHPMELFEGRRIVASVFGDFKGKSQLPHFANQCIKGVVKLDEFITHEMPFSRINEAMQLLSDGTSLRCLLHL